MVALREGCVDRNIEFSCIILCYLSHSARGAWIETVQESDRIYLRWSHSARGAWIETLISLMCKRTSYVALREGCVDRNYIIDGGKYRCYCRTPRGVRG